MSVLFLIVLTYGIIVYTMRFLCNPIKFNPYLMRLTKGERSLNWFSALAVFWICLWCVGCFLILIPISNEVFTMLNVTSIIGFPLSILAIPTFVTAFVLIGTQFTMTETQSGQLALLRLTNISQEAIFGSIVLGIIYRTRRWLTWLLGGCPFWAWIICFWYTRWAPGNALNIFVSPLGHTYLYSDGPTEATLLLTNGAS